MTFFLLHLALPLTAYWKILPLCLSSEEDLLFFMGLLQDCWSTSDSFSQIMWSWVMWLKLTKSAVAQVSQDTGSRGLGGRQTVCEKDVGRAGGDPVSRAHASLLFLWKGNRCKRHLWRLRGLEVIAIEWIPVPLCLSLQSWEVVKSKLQRTETDLLEISVFRNQKWAGALVEVQSNISKHCQGEQAAELLGSDGCERAGEASSQPWMCGVHLDMNQAEPTTLHIKGHGTVWIPFAGSLFKRQSWPPRL